MSGSINQDSNPFDAHTVDPSGSYQTRLMNPGDVIQVYNNQDDNETVLTDLQTIEYMVGQRNLFPATQDMSSSDSDDDKHLALNSIPEEDGRSAATPASNDSYRDSTIPSKAYTYIPPNEKKMMGSAYVPDQHWKGQLESQIGALPSRLSSSTPTIGDLHYDDQGAALKEQLKNNTAAVARVGSHAGGGASTGFADPNWMEDLHAAIQSMPTPVPRAAAESSLQYDHRGRALKSSVVQDPATAGRVGAFAEGGPAAFSRIRTSRMEGPTNQTACAQGGSSAFREEDNQVPGQEKSGGDDPSNLNDGNNSIQTKPWWKSAQFHLAMVALILVIIAVVVVVPLIHTKKGGTEDNQEGQAPVEDPVDEGFDLSLVPGLFNSTILALNDTDSAQYKAFDWISKDPTWDNYEDWRKQQRFAMACLHFSFDIDFLHSYQYLDGMDYNVDECDWESRLDHCPKNDGVIRELGDATVMYPGQLPPEIALLSNLEVMFYSLKKMPSLESMFPVDVAMQLSLLREITFRGDELKGSVPSSFGLFTRLTYLDLSENLFTSTIPTELGLLSNLTTLILSDNNLSGTIPEELGSLSFLTVFEANTNVRMEPPVPSGFCTDDHANWKNLQADWCTGIEQCCHGM